MRQISTPKRFLALTLNAGILTGGLALSSAIASAAEPAAVATPAPQAHSIDDAVTIEWFDRFERDWREAARKYNEADQRVARYSRWPHRQGPTGLFRARSHPLRA